MVASGRRTLCRVQRTVPPSRRTRNGLPLTPAARNSPPRDQDAGPREKVARVSSELHGLPPHPGCVRGGQTLSFAPHPPGQWGPAARHSSEEPGSVLGRCRGWGAAPLPSPPDGGRAGWGARARRTGSSCGPWGPWRAIWSAGLGTRDSGSRAAVPARLPRAARGAAATAGCVWRGGGGLFTHR